MSSEPDTIGRYETLIGYVIKVIGNVYENPELLKGEKR
jgi:hypothetical protein